MSTARLMFLEGINENYIERIKTEMSGFPKDKRDDVLDTLADICAANTDIASYSNPKVARFKLNCSPSPKRQPLTSGPR